MERGLLDLCLAGLRRLEQAGCVIAEATLGVGRETTWDSFVTLRQGFTGGKLAPYFADPATRDALKPEALWEIEGGLRRSAVDLFAASRQRSAVYAAYRAAFERFDFLALPSAQVFPFDATLPWPPEIAGWRWTATTAGWRSLPAPASPAARPSRCPWASAPRGYRPVCN